MGHVFIGAESLALTGRKVHHMPITRGSTPLRLIVRVVKGGQDPKEA